MLFMYNVLAFVASHFLFIAVNGQLQNLIVCIAEQGTILTSIKKLSSQVNVGLQGSFYSPETISVPENTSVTFEFFGA